MNLEENWEYIAYQDSTSETSSESSTLNSDAQNLKVNKPQLLAIPETPKRFTQTQKKVKVEAKPKTFVPTPEDSVNFNLITRKTESNILKQTIVHDYLNPIPLSNKTWLNINTKDVLSVDNSSLVIDNTLPQDTLLTSHVSEIKNIAETNISNSDTIKVTNQEIKDSIQITEIAQNNLATKKDSTQTLIEVPSILPFKEHKNIDKDILSGLILLAVAVTGFLRFTNYKYLRELFAALIFSQNARKMQKTVNLHYRTPAFILNGLFLFNASIFLYQIINYYHLKTIFNQSLFLIPAFMLLIIAFGMTKVALYRFVAYVFETKPETKEYLFFNFLNNKIFAIAILPIIIVVPYIEAEIVPVLFKIGGVIFISLYFIQLFRGLAIILKNVASLFYMFLYLCALEILPLIIIYNILIR
ncbi:DUF4271 domain-containing protein [Plebeiibacterium sediminum]|uniref:DUF4271 domain-containing protein n=1 Tax=Plebeiibacterium sediminum TaxID=2992112 RepID=A0AAE3SGW3_9BACT|nr:DUF4271 domain-containing protein [Plebeiobacterium sediminum]MCW3788731.1 DUF4271 domain-containing protein [Plebeiobacterium sediminum]